MIKLLYEFIEDVKKNDGNHCKYVKLAVDRHLTDLEKTDTPYYFDEREAQRVLKIISTLPHTSGKYYGKRFMIQPSQAFKWGCVFGWRKKSTKKRRFTKVYDCMARGGGKTEGTAAIKFVMAYGDGENNPEVYSIATKEEQARLSVKAFTSMVKQVADRSARIRMDTEIGKYAVHIKSNNGIIKALPRDWRRLDGLRPSYCTVDEFHEHPDAQLVGVIETAGQKREQFLIWYTTTRGFNMESPCFYFDEYVIDILQGIRTNERIFGMIATLDEGDDWHDKSKWIKPMPLLGITPYMEGVEDLYQQAVDFGGVKEVEFVTKAMNKWTASVETWIPDEKYQACQADFTEKDLYGQECFGGLDLAQAEDINAFSLFFPENRNRPHRILTWAWCPEDTVRIRARKESTSYDQWIKEGWIETMPGPVTDDETIIKKILELKSKFKIRTIGYDPYGARYIVKQLKKGGLKTDPFAQSIPVMATPTIELKKLYIKGAIQHNGNRLARKHFQNVHCVVDKNYNEHVHKGKSKDKVDAVVSQIIAFGEWYDPNRRPRRIKKGIIVVPKKAS